MKKLMLGAALTMAAVTTHAAAGQLWQIRATYTYEQSDGSLLTGLPAMEFVVPMGECREGHMRFIRLAEVDIPVVQRACLRTGPHQNGSGQTPGLTAPKPASLTIASGWVAPAEVIRDMGQEDGVRRNPMSLLYGQQFDIETNSTYVSTRVGPYIIELKRLR